jgi:iron complex outermembrane receptor protein
LYDRDNTGDAYRFIGNLQLNYKVHGLEDLNLNVNVGTDMSKTNGTDGVNVGSIQAYRDSEATGCGQYRDWNDFHRNQILETYADYSHKFLGKHTVNIMAGYSWQHFYTSRHEIRYTNPYSIDSATGDYINGSDHASVLIGEMSNYPYNRTEYYLLSYYGRLNYSYESKYLFTATLRNDASSRFSKDNRWGLFPSAAIAWNVKNENFLKRNDFISTLKLRASWGETGQQEINDGDYPYMSRYVESTDQYSQYNMGSDGFFQKYTPQAYDPNIKWETTTTYNAGFDLGVMKDKVTMNADFYYRKTKDLLNNVTVPLGSNFSNTVLTNVGSMENKGIELSLNYTPINTQYSSMQIGVNCTFQKIKFTKLNKSDDPDYAVSTGDIHAGTGGFLQYQKVGYAPYTYFLYQQAYDEDGRPIQNALVDRNSDGKLSAADRYMTNKSPNPDFFFGINFKYNYRNWDFAFSGHGSVGNWLFNDFESENSQAYIVIASAFLPNITKYALNNNFTSANITEQFYSDMFLHNASFFRMDNIEGGYTFKNVDKKGVDIRIALGVSNVFIITRYPGMDPEATDVNGIDSNIWPRPRTFSLKLNVNF